LPLSAKGRIEVYVPDPLDQSYRQVRAALEDEFTFNFGGCSVIKRVVGNYLANDGSIDRDRVNVIYTDTPYNFEENLTVLTSYANEMREAVSVALKSEEAILVAVYPVFHSV
jgi:3'-phosphoadenosine 5'-phosphosulfate sulfotransferase (PAPS reductase)/FAD synthetase